MDDGRKAKGQLKPQPKWRGDNPLQGRRRGRWEGPLNLEHMYVHTRALHMHACQQRAFCTPLFVHTIHVRVSLCLRVRMTAVFFATQCKSPTKKLQEKVLQKAATRQLRDERADRCKRGHTYGSEASRMGAARTQQGRGHKAKGRRPRRPEETGEDREQ